jgi:ATP-dependent RNA helicase DDX51/DBP6
MFAVERFGLPPNDIKQTTTENNLSFLLQKSKERLKRKQAIALLSHTEEQERTKKTSSSSFSSSTHSKPQNISVLLETKEEKIARKALAKAEKKERKEKLRELQEKEEKEEKENENERDREQPFTISSVLREKKEENNQKVDNVIEKTENIMETSSVQTPSLHPIAKTPVSYAPFSAPNKPKKEESKSAPLSAWIPPAVSITERVRVAESIEKWGVDKNLAADLMEDNVQEYFPVQIAVIPLLLSHLNHQPFAPPRDMIVSAPTGSGKTLAYALPIIQALSRSLSVISEGLSVERKKRMPRKLQALIILPSRELVTQVDFHNFTSQLRAGISSLLSSESQHIASNRTGLWAH